LEISFWKDKRVLITGHTGFKGAWLSIFLNTLGARVSGLSLPPSTTPNLYELSAHGMFESEIFLDLRDKKSVENFLGEAEPDIVFHLAAQASVLEGYRDPYNTWTSNVLGTLNLLDGLSELKKDLTLIVVTTDKVYKNLNDGRLFVETDELGGSDPYSASKVAVEEMITSYRRVIERNEAKISIGVARAGNVIGGGDFLPERILPDAMKAITSKTKLRVRNPHSIRPWQHVLDPLSGYIELAEKLSCVGSKSFEGAFNFSNSNILGLSVVDLLKLIPTEFDLEIEFAADSGDNYEAKLLNLNSEKAERMLRWKAKIGINDAVKLTFEWNKSLANHDDMRAISKSQIEKYLANEV